MREQHLEPASETSRIGACAAIAWCETLDVCPDAICQRLTGSSVPESFHGSEVPDEKACGFRFYGIAIRMFFVDHEPPHSHAEYGGWEAQFGVEDLVLLAENCRLGLAAWSWNGPQAIRRSSRKHGVVHG